MNTRRAESMIPFVTDGSPGAFSDGPHATPYRKTTMTRMRWFPLLLLAAACEDPGTSSTPLVDSGVFTLQSIDTRALPTAEPCSPDLIVAEEISFYQGNANYKQRGTRPATGQPFAVAGTGSYLVRPDRFVVADLTITRPDAPQQTYNARFVFELSEDGRDLTQMVGMPCDGRSAKRFTRTGVIN